MLVLGYIGRLAILYSGGVNVLVDFLHPVAVGYWLAMAVIKTVINELCPTVLFMEAGSSPSNYGGEMIVLSQLYQLLLLLVEK